ncbi:ABC transporter ATP-binding protein [Paludibacterium purpuratum]|uniref:Putative ABC transport system ATP-binding protein n=1 Tax=Paludibacterium purpuratum TaxID=1144873 RepID=A0A4R7BBG8_9NEIS|nr:ATP-binding cassette domain-containing protein [Paludibacterium purpuratum]TDR81412.1 putative ABC transport system ATP-binding protein [Paludibacterium purpuratum]
MSDDPKVRVLSATHLARNILFQGETISILHDISLDVYHGDSVAIVGVSGSGKSTLLSLLAGLDLPTSGEVVLFGQPLMSLDEDGRALLRRRQVGFVFQSFQLMSPLTALENVMLPLALAGETNARERATDMLARVGLAHRLRHYPRHLSGGEQQRVALARAFVGGPALLFADEPTGNLDTVSGAQVIELLFELNREQGTALVLVTHDADLAERCGTVYRLAQGRLSAERS